MVLYLQASSFFREDRRYLSLTLQFQMDVS
jgi:hypothetical protein